jgi:hypothetical protein
MSDESSRGFLSSLAKGIGYFVLVVVGLSIGIQALTGGDSQEGGLKIVSHDWEYGEYSPRVVGIVKNTSNQNYSYAQVEVSIYQGNTQIGTTMANTSNLRPGDRWRFEAIVMEEVGQGARYEISDITAY